MPQYLRSRREGPIEYLTLNRPEVRNALNDSAIAELTDWAEGAGRQPDLRAVVLAGEGPTFCAGADTSWFARTAQYSEDDNRRDAATLARMFTALDSLPVPLIGRIHGAALGGGAGLAAVCDIVVAESRTLFGFTEVRLGLVPGVISPFVLAKIGLSAARELFLTGARFTAARAREIGLVHLVVPDTELDRAVASYANDLLSAAPGAVLAAKFLIKAVCDKPLNEAMPIATDAIATRLVSAEAQEGLHAFVQKRKPSWTT